MSGYRKIIEGHRSRLRSNPDLKLSEYYKGFQVERINRYIPLFRNNSLFFGSYEGAKRGCAFYSLACSCRCNGINFFNYLSDVLNKATDLPHLTPESCRNLLPDRRIKE